MKKVKFKKYHQYAGVEYNKGDDAEVTDSAYKRMLKKGVIEGSGTEKAKPKA